jgi:hypothetical protein
VAIWQPGPPGPYPPTPGTAQPYGVRQRLPLSGPPSSPPFGHPSVTDPKSATNEIINLAWQPPPPGPYQGPTAGLQPYGYRQFTPPSGPPSAPPIQHPSTLTAIQALTRLASEPSAPPPWQKIPYVTPSAPVSLPPFGLPTELKPYGVSAATVRQMWEPPFLGAYNLLPGGGQPWAQNYKTPPSGPPSAPPIGWRGIQDTTAWQPPWTGPPPLVNFTAAPPSARVPWTQPFQDTTAWQLAFTLPQTLPALAQSGPPSSPPVRGPLYFDATVWQPPWVGPPPLVNLLPPGTSGPPSAPPIGWRAIQDTTAWQALWTAPPLPVPLPIPPSIIPQVPWTPAFQDTTAWQAAFLMPHILPPLVPVSGPPPAPPILLRKGGDDAWKKRRKHEILAEFKQIRDARERLRAQITLALEGPEAPLVRDVLERHPAKAAQAGQDAGIDLEELLSNIRDLRKILYAASQAAEARARDDDDDDVFLLM